MKKSDYLKRKLYKIGGYAFWGQENAHEWLTSWYGDYMTPPPEDKRCAVHNYELYVEAEK
jgi:phosphorylcholine metabolism protein LicD